MLFHDDVVAHRKTEPGSFASRFGRKKGVEYLFLYLGSNPDAIVADADFDSITETFRCCPQRRLEPVAGPSCTFGRSIKSVGDQVEQDAGDFLRKRFDRASCRIEFALQSNIETRLLGARTAIGEIKAFLNKRVDFDLPMLAGTLARMKEHVPDDGVGALAVLHDFL